MEDTYFQLKENPIEYFVSDDLSPSPHLHREVELVYAERGSVRAFSDKKYYDVCDGDFFISFPNQVHYYENSTPGKYHVLILSPDIIYGAKHVLLEECPKYSVVKIPDPKMLENLLSALKNAAGKYAETEKAGLACRIISYVLVLFDLKPRTKSNNPTLAQILSFCEQNFRDDLTLDTLSERLHLSKYYISRLFNQKLCIGFSTYLNMIRISNACDLLAETDKKTSDISEEVGFGSIRSFNRAFGDIMNTTPVKYRLIKREQTNRVTK